jgi:hypothetical protein
MFAPVTLQSELQRSPGNFMMRLKLVMPVVLYPIFVFENPSALGKASVQGFAFLRQQPRLALEDSHQTSFLGTAATLQVSFRRFETPVAFVSPAQYSPFLPAPFAQRNLVRLQSAVQSALLTMKSSALFFEPFVRRSHARPLFSRRDRVAIDQAASYQQSG